MKKLLLTLPLLYWYGTSEPIRQYQPAEITCGEFKGEQGIVNFFWASGPVDILSFDYTQHFYVLDYKCLRKLK